MGAISNESHYFPSVIGVDDVTGGNGVGVERVIGLSEKLMGIAEELSTLASAAFTGEEAKNVIKAIDDIGEEEWKIDRMGRKFAMKFYSMENQLDPITILFLDKYCKALGAVANTAEKTAKYLRLIIRKK